MTQKAQSTGKSQPILQLLDVCKIYQLGAQTIKALDCLDFNLYEGEFVAIIGPSGSGKSTFLQVASMLAEPSKGKIFLKGTIFSCSSNILLKSIIFIFTKFETKDKYM